MDNLPTEMWHLIFDHLQVVDLFSCAQVSKAVYLVVKSYRVREIAFTGRIHKWFHYTTPITNHKHRVDFTMTSILRQSFFNFDYLKRLKIGRPSVIDLDVINKFTRLEELDIDLKNYESEKSRTLSLANLKVLYLLVPSCLSYVELDTPRLAKLCSFSLEVLEFVYPESIRCIHTFFHSGKLKTFRNLEYLAITDSYNQLNDLRSYYYPSIGLFSVKKGLKNLKEVDFYCSYRYEEDNMSVFKRMIANLLALKRPDLKVFWQNVQITDPNLLTEYERINDKIESRIAFQLKHHDKLKEKVEFFPYYDFNDSMRLLKEAGLDPRSEEFTSKFFPKYSFRKIGIIGKIEEPEFLLQLIARSPNLFELEFENSGLDQSFFDRMADTIRLNAIPLRSLRLNGPSNGFKNFEFLLKFCNLKRFETDQDLPKLIPKLLKLPMLTEIEFGSGRTKHRIKQLSRSRFLLNGLSFSLKELSNFLII